MARFSRKCYMEKLNTRTLPRFHKDNRLKFLCFKDFFIGINDLAKKVVIATEKSMNEGKKRRLGTIAKKKTDC